MPSDTATSTEIRGCASHSEFQNEKLLDEIRTKIQAQQPVPEPYDDWTKGVLDGCEIAINVIDEMKKEWRSKS
jgi:hypothetical protein